MNLVTIPVKARENARAAIAANYLKKDKCATGVGKKRAEQIVADEFLTLATAKRTFSYLSRARVYNTGDWMKCGTISYNLWGGEAMYLHLKKIFKR
jgi:hypothetical protein